jgi:hypothetical protein
MNAIAFGTKRAFHSFLRVTRRGFASVGLTAARFDRKPPPSDRRQRHVMLTDSGRLRLQSAWSLLVRAVRRLVYEAICLGRHRDPEQRWIRMAELEGYLDALRRNLGDAARLRYPWGHPDD